MGDWQGRSIDISLSLATIHFMLMEVRGNRDYVLLLVRKVTHWGNAVGHTERSESMNILLLRGGGEDVRARF